MTDRLKMSGWVHARLTDRHTPLLRGCQCQSKGTVAGTEGCVTRQTTHLKRGASPCTTSQELAKPSILAAIGDGIYIPVSRLLLPTVEVSP